MLSWREYIEAENTDDRREYGRMCSGITVFRQGRALIVMPPNQNFRVLSSGFTNGGYVDSPQAVVNVTGMGGQVEFDIMMGGLDENDECAEEYMRKLGFDPSKAVPLGTAANMDNAAIRKRISNDGIEVSAAITAGISHNGGRSGDPASFDESAAVYGEKPGTIITIIAIDADLSDGAMFEAMLQATEAKSCVIQELQARSLYSHSIATGSGTDQVAIIVNKASDVKIDSLERGSSLAVTLAECVRECLLEAFDWQAAMNKVTQWDPLVQVQRYGIEFEMFREEIRFPARMQELKAALDSMRTDRHLATTVSAIMRMEDEVENGLIEEKDAVELSKRIASQMILKRIEDPAEKLRLESIDSVKGLLSYTMAMKLMDVVKERRLAHGQ